MNRLIGGRLYNLTKTNLLPQVKYHNIDTDHAPICYLPLSPNKLQVLGNFTSASINKPDIQSHLLNGEENFIGQNKAQHIVLVRGTLYINRCDFQEDKRITKYILNNKNMLISLVQNRSSDELIKSLEELQFANIDTAVIKHSVHMNIEHENKCMSSSSIEHIVNL